MATRTLTELLQTYNRPNPKIENALLATPTPEKFNRRGAQVDSGRVLTDIRKLVPTAIAVWEDADLPQRKLLTGIGRGMFCVVVDQWSRLETLWASHEGNVTGDRGVRQVGTVSQVDAHRTAMVARNGAVAALSSLAGADLQRRLALDVATGRADTEESLAQGLESIASLGRTWMTHADLADLAADVCIDEGWAGGLEATAQVLRDATESATRRMTVQVTQAKLDYQDGVLLLLLGKLIRIFDVANTVDRRIPRLFPSSTYHVFGRRRVADRGETETEAEEPVVAPASDVNGATELVLVESQTA